MERIRERKKGRRACKQVVVLFQRRPDPGRLVGCMHMCSCALIAPKELLSWPVCHQLLGGVGWPWGLARGGQLSVPIQLWAGCILWFLFIKVLLLFILCYNVQVVEVGIVIHCAVVKVPILAI